MGATRGVIRRDARNSGDSSYDHLQAKGGPLDLPKSMF